MKFRGEADKYNRAEGRSNKAQGEFERALTLYGDQDAAMLDSRMRKLSNVQAMISEQAQMKGLDQTSQMRLAQMGQAAENAYLETAQQLYDRIAGTITKQEVTLKPQGEVMKAARGGAGGGTGTGGASTRGAGAKYGMSPEAYAKLSKENRGLAVKLPNGRFKFARSPEDRKEVQGTMNATTDMVNILRQVQQWRSQKWNTASWTEKKGQIEANMTRLLELSKKKDMLGALDKGLLEFASKKFGNPEEFTLGSGGEIDGKLAQQITNIQNEQQGVIEARSGRLSAGPHRGRHFLAWNRALIGGRGRQVRRQDRLNQGAEAPKQTQLFYKDGKPIPVEDVARAVGTGEAFSNADNVTVREGRASR